jgi:A/G-specific adenine glycosylase
MKSFPSLKALAEAPRQDVMKAWEGLGYYARARNAHKTAKFISREHHGRFPRTIDELRKLPGIGPYTAAAVGSLVFGLDVAVLDGNVIRVISRLYRFGEDPAGVASRRRLQSRADQHLVPGVAGEVNEAMMELGATICTPQAPACDVCPMRTVCEARKHRDPEKFPAKTRQSPIPHRHVGAGVIVNRARKILVARRPDHAMLGGLWEFPGGGQQDGETLPACVRRELLEELGIHVRVGPHLVTVRHAFTHFTMDLHAYWVRIERGRPRAIESSEYRWVGVEEIGNFPLPRADQKILKDLKRSEFPMF